MNEIYSEIKARRDKDKAEERPMPSKLAMNVKVRLQNHVGRANKILVPELSQQLWGKFDKTTQRQIRDAVSELVCNFDEAIVADYESNEGGLFYAATEEEFEEAINNLRSRRDVLNQRIDSLYRKKTEVLHMNKKATQNQNQDSLFSMTPGNFI